DIKWGERLGFKVAFTRFFCLSTYRYNEALRKRLKELIEKEKVVYFKHDFNYFVCGRVGHGHFISPDQSSEANVNALLSVLKYEAELNPDLFLAVTSGLWPSPWWLPYCDTIWMGGRDHDANKKIPVLRGSEFEMNYRDGALYKMLVKEGKVFPLSALMTHGVVDARHSVYNMTKEDDIGWCNYLMNYLGRGTLMREFYLSPEQITSKRWEMIARGLRWAKSLDDCMANSHFILGNPMKGELFGYQGSCGDKSYVSLRNPTFSDTNISLRVFGMTNKTYEVVYPFHKILQDKEFDNFIVPANSVVQVMNYSKNIVKIPVIKGVRSELLKSEIEETEYKVSISSGTRIFTVNSPVNIKSISGDGILSEKINDKKWKVTISDTISIEKSAAKILSSQLTDVGVLICTAVIPKGKDAKVIMIIGGAEKAAPLTSINGSETANSTFVGDGWRQIEINCVTGTNEIRVGLQGIEKPINDVPVQVFFDTVSKLKTHLIKIKHENLLPVSIYDKPFPVMQNLTEHSRKIVDKKVTLSSASSLLRGYRALKQKQLREITNAFLRFKRFDVNGGKYADKKIFINRKYIGKIPPNPAPLSEWKECEIMIQEDVLKGLKLANKVSLKDKTGDAYKIRDLQIEVVLSNGKQVTTAVNTLVYSTSLEWELGEGEELSRDGTTVTILSF
ncbi:MAG: hypothetical protein DRI44_08585, partial [Chlamydiae bacterium]